MRLSYKWQSDFTDCMNIPIEKYCDVMTRTGSKVENFERLGREIENVRVGRILKIEQHPDAERLVVCRVDIGERELQIVTAAKNVFEGALVPVAVSPQGEKIVARLHGGVEIKTGKLRGVVSEGMFCSIEELGLTSHDMPFAATDGILILDEGSCAPGDDICSVLGMYDEAIEFEITPNRPDCLSVIGLARECAASFGLALKVPEPRVKGSGGDVGEYLGVTISDTEKCLRYSARVVRNVKVEPSPLWLRMRLRASGVRPINNIVDITNYVMLEYGQPMHAFDYGCLSGKQINIRTAGADEKFTTLDGTERALEGDMLVIADGRKPVAVAGVMGGANSEITPDTVNVVFESASFLGSSVRITAKKLGMRTESSSRFEKGLDSEMTLPALERACELVEALGAGEVVDGVIDVYPNPKKTAKVAFDAARINSFLGINVSEAEMIRLLERLSFRIEDGYVVVPSYRDDVRCMNDVAEEVVRMYGYDKIESGSMTARMTQGGLDGRQTFREKLHSVLCGLGLSEIYTFSFMSSKLYDKCGMSASDPRRNSVLIMNPFGEDTRTMRTTSVPSMLETLELNSSRSAGSAALYEMAKVYIPRENVVTNIHGLEGTLPDERVKLSVGLFGDGADFYRLKGICEEILSFAGIDAGFVPESGDPTYHPGRCAVIKTREGTEIGRFGELHPTVMKNYTFSAPVYIAELDMEALSSGSGRSVTYKPLPKFPSVTRDFSFVCGEELTVGEIEDAMRKSGTKLIENIELFDIYRGAQTGEGKKSVSFSVTLRAPDRTLTDEEAEKASQKILSSVQRLLGIGIRM